MSALNDIRIYDWMEIFVAYLKTLFRITENHKLYNEVTTKSTADKYQSGCRTGRFAPLMSRSAIGHGPKIVPSMTILIA
jgi:hypothetical protein